MKKNFGIILGALLIVAVSGIVYLQNSLINERHNSEIIAVTATEQYIESTIALADQLASQYLEKSAHQTATAMVEASAETIEEIKTINAALKADLDRANEIALCPNIPDSIDYSSNRTVSNSLKAWIEEVESIHTVEWKAVWNNSKTTIHNLTGEHLSVFIVYFEDDLGYENRIYSVSQACFIDY